MTGWALAYSIALGSSIAFLAVISVLTFTYQKEKGRINAYGFREDPREQRRQLKREVDRRIKASQPSSRCNCMMWMTRTPPRHDDNCNVWRPTLPGSPVPDPEIATGYTSCGDCGELHAPGEPPLAQTKLV